MIILNSWNINREENDINVRFTLDDYKWHGDIPVMPESEIQPYLEAHEDEYMCGIYRKQYHDAIIQPAKDESLRQAWERWIKEGHTNIIKTIVPQIVQVETLDTRTKERRKEETEDVVVIGDERVRERRTQPIIERRVLNIPVEIDMRVDPAPMPPIYRTSTITEDVTTTTIIEPKKWRDTHKE